MRTFEIRFKRCNHWDIHRENELLQTVTIEATSKEKAMDILANKWPNFTPVIQNVLENGIDEGFECYEYLCRRHGLDCWAVFRRYGYGDHALVHEYMPNQEGDFFDNEGHDKTIFETESGLTRSINQRFIDHAQMVFDANNGPFSMTYVADLERSAKKKRI